ncbi:MAG: hypothetical protein RID23_15190 [Roseovarius sp.]
MSNIDLSQVITAEDKQRRAAEARQLAAKTECRRRILAVVDEMTQMNLAHALLTEHARRRSGGSAPALTDDDVATILRMQDWIAEMQAACAGAMGGADHWPAPPGGLAALAARF